MSHIQVGGCVFSYFEWDRWWQTLDDIKKIVQVCHSVSAPQVRLFKMYKMNYDICSINFLLRGTSDLPHPIPPHPSLFTLTDIFDPQHPPEQSFTALWSALSLTLRSVKKRYSTNNRPKCGSLPLLCLLSFSLSILFDSLVHMQYRTMQRRRTGWRLMTGLVTWWHTKG